MKADPPVLNPFPFAADTAFRFALLAVAAVAASVSLGLLNLLSPFQSFDQLEACVTGVVKKYAPAAQAALALSTEELFAMREEALRCLEGYSAFGSFLLPVLIPVAVVALAAAALAVNDPAWLVRRHRLQPASDAVRAALTPHLAALGESLRVSVMPTTLWQPTNGDINAFVFGSNRRPQLAVTYGLVLALNDNQAEHARAILAHELAHVANRDITVDRLTRALFWGFLGALGPLYIALLFYRLKGSEPLDLLNEVARVMAAAGILFLARNAVLRARERYTDLRAGLDERTNATLTNTFAENAARERLWDRHLLWPLRKHPLWSVRHAGLRSTADLFRPPFVDAAVFSFVFVVVAMPIMIVVFWYADEALLDESPFAVSALLFGPLVPLALLFTGAVAMMAWRASFAELLTGARSRTALLPALGAALGVTVGLYAAPFGGGGIQGVELEFGWFTTSGGRLYLLPGLVGAFFAFFYPYFLWVRRTTRAWAARLATDPNGARPSAWLVGLAGVPVALVLPPLVLTSVIAVFAFDLLVAIPGLGWGEVYAFVVGGLIAAVAVNPLSLVALAVVAGLPLLAARRRVGPETARWPLLRGRLPRPPQAPPLRPLRAVVVGVFGGAALSAAAFHGPGGAIFAVGGTAAFARLAFVAALPALVAALAAPSLRLEHGLFAGTVSALVVTGHFFFLIHWAGDSPSALGLWLLVTLSFALSGGLALVGATMGGLIGMPRAVRSHWT